MRIIVTGGRDWVDTLAVEAVFKEINARYGPDIVLVHGAQGGMKERRGQIVPVGLDFIAAQEAERLGWTLEPHPADWYAPCRWSCQKDHRRYHTDGSSTCPAQGPYRNMRMAAKGADLCLSWSGGSGTKHMERQARRHKIPVVRVQRGEPLPDRLDAA